jgi:hypothetical protein
VTISVNADADDPTAAVLRKLAAENVEGTVVRLQIKVPAEKEGLIQETEIRNALADAYFIAAISRDVPREHRKRLAGQSAEALPPLDALRLYLESKKTPEERIRLLLEYGERLIQQSAASE